MGFEMITVYVGDVTEYLSEVAIKADPNATLITTSMIDDISPGTYYTSVGDISDLSNFAKVLRQANLIVYAPPDKWSDSFFGKSKMQSWTEDCLKDFAYFKPIENLPDGLIPAIPENKSIMLPHRGKTSCPARRGEPHAISHRPPKNAPARRAFFQHRRIRRGAAGPMETGLGPGWHSGAVRPRQRF